ncbi:putative zinc finger, CCHC-type containing protein [Tanacetum coccineum]
MGKDGKPIKVLRNVHFEADADTSVPVNDLPMQSAIESLSENDSNIGSTSKVAILEDVQVEPAISVKVNEEPKSFASILNKTTTKKVVKLVPLTNDEVIKGAHVTLPLAAAEKVLENGPWLIRLVPIILNVWTPTSKMKKDEITTVPVWVKLHNVPIVAYYEIGLSLLTVDIISTLLRSTLRDRRRKGRGIPTINSKLIKRKRRSSLCRAFGVLGLTTERRDGLKEKETKIAVAREGKEASPRTTQRKGLRCPVLNNTNYTLWALRIKKILVANGVWDLVEGTSTSKEIDVKKDSSASAYLFQGLLEDLQMQVAGCETAKEIWDSLKAIFIGTEDVQQAHSQQLKSEFERLIMKEDETIDSFTGKLMSIITKAATCGLTFDEQTKVQKLLNAVPDKFVPVVATIEMIVDFKTVKLEEIIGKLKTYEERLKFRKGSEEDNSEKLLLTRQRNNINYKHNHGNGRRGGGNQTRGRWKDRDKGHTSDESEGTDNKPQRNGDKS